MSANELRGVYPVVSTPFHEDGSVDHEGIERIIEAQIDRGNHGGLLFGIAAEFYKLGDDERKQIVTTTWRCWSLSSSIGYRPRLRHRLQ